MCDATRHAAASATQPSEDSRHEIAPRVHVWSSVQERLEPRVAGGSFAMGQATDAVKAAAKAVTAPNDEDGVAQAIERLLREGDAVFARTVDLTKPRASGEKTRHGIRIADIVVMGQ